MRNPGDGWDDHRFVDLAVTVALVLMAVLAWWVFFAPPDMVTQAHLFDTSRQVRW